MVNHSGQTPKTFHTDKSNIHYSLNHPSCIKKKSLLACNHAKSNSTFEHLKSTRSNNATVKREADLTTPFLDQILQLFWLLV